VTTTLDISVECPQCEADVSILNYDEGLAAVNSAGIKSCFTGPLDTHLDAVVEHLAKVQHDAYETAAVVSGWETQADSRKPWADVPEANKRTMRSSITALLAELVAM